MHATLPQLISALMQPSLYPHPVSAVELLQTHISWVLLAGEFAYKIKKPLTLQFLDFGTLEKRRFYCEEELRLNRRFAPELYLEVVCISGSPQEPLLGGAGVAIEYAVKMRRFDEAGRLDRVCERGELQPEHLTDLAQGLVAFHEAAAVAPMDSRFGTPATVLAPMIENLNISSELLQGADCQDRLDALRAWTKTQWERLTPLLQQRRSSGHVRECHGDLHLGNLVLIQGRVRMFDCIEFNPDYRWIDVASDIAFTTMDLVQHGHPGLANWFVNQVFSASGDYEAAQLLRFYAVYRALVRAKVAAIRAAQEAGARDKNVDEAMHYIGLAERLAKPNAPSLVITHGLAGCGKTTASNRLLLEDPDANTLRLRSDVERKRLYGLSALQRSGSSLDGGIYVADAHERTYGRLHDLAQMLLLAGWSVVVDAAFLRRAERARFADLAQRCGAAFAILAPQVTVEQLRERVSARQAAGRDASEATLDVLEKQLGWIEPLDEHELSFRLEQS
jgi:aminoglycoside phosphotransferase family enzyme/predicted kinase